MSSATSSPAAAFGAILGATGLLAVAMAFPPVSPCDAPVGVAHAALALAQALALVAVVLLRRAGQGGPLLAAVVATWSLLSGFVLAIRTCAGSLRSLDAVDLAHAGGGALALACLLAGLSARLVDASSGRVAVMSVLAAVAGLAATVLMDSRAVSKTWTTWARVEAAAQALESAAERERLPPADAPTPLRELAGALPSDATSGLVMQDAWGHDLVVVTAGRSWRVASLGSDGEKGPYDDGPSRDYADDLVIEDGTPVAWPEHPCTGLERAAPAKKAPKDLRIRRGP